jgi:hypothetical protein
LLALRLVAVALTPRGRAVLYLINRFEGKDLKGQHLLKVNDDRPAASWEALFSINGLNGHKWFE